MIGTDEPIGGGGGPGRTEHHRQEQCGVQGDGGGQRRKAAVARRGHRQAAHGVAPPGVAWPSRVGGGLAPDDGPPVSVIRLMSVKPDDEIAAITWATMA